MDSQGNNMMLISKDRNKYAKINQHKVLRGQFNTVENLWLKKHIVDFLGQFKGSACLDPFAGKGDILAAMKGLGFQTEGLDIDPALGWDLNDSLTSIPEKYRERVIVTNPPFLAKYSATRKRVSSSLKEYYSVWEDLYMQALDVCKKDRACLVAIVPETFLNSSYPKDNCHSITIISENPFTDTDCPVCVLCMSDQSLAPSEIKVYIDDMFVSTWDNLRSNVMVPSGILNVKFNDPQGNIGLQAVDLTSVDDKIRFLPADELDYPRENIKISSRLVTYLSVDNLPDTQVLPLIELSNFILSQWRKDTKDMLLSPFKGNAKDGTRRRRLDYRTARTIMEQAYAKITGIPVQQKLF